MDDLKIIRDGDCRNFASWTIEKLSNAISGHCHIKIII